MVKAVTRFISVMLLLMLWLSLFLPIVNAGRLNQTVPTAPPPTTEAPTILPSETSVTIPATPLPSSTPPRSTAISTLPLQTINPIVTTTSRITPTSPNSSSNQTLAASSSTPTAGSQIFPTLSSAITTTATPTPVSPGGTWMLYGIIIGVLVIGVVIIVVGWINKRHE